MSLGVSLISGLIVFLIHEHRLRLKAQKAVSDTLAAYEVSRAAMTARKSRAVKDPLRPQELEHTQSQPAELYDGEIHEANIRI